MQIPPTIESREHDSPIAAHSSKVLPGVSPGIVGASPLVGSPKPGIVGAVSVTGTVGAVVLPVVREGTVEDVGTPPVVVPVVGTPVAGAVVPLCEGTEDVAGTVLAVPVVGAPVVGAVVAPVVRDEDEGVEVEGRVVWPAAWCKVRSSTVASNDVLAVEGGMRRTGGEGARSQPRN